VHLLCPGPCRRRRCAPEARRAAQQGRFAAAAGTPGGPPPVPPGHEPGPELLVGGALLCGGRPQQQVRRPEVIDARQGAGGGASPQALGVALVRPGDPVRGRARPPRAPGRPRGPGHAGPHIQEHGYRRRGGSGVRTSCPAAAAPPSRRRPHRCMIGHAGPGRPKGSPSAEAGGRGPPGDRAMSSPADNRCPPAAAPGPPPGARGAIAARTRRPRAALAAGFAALALGAVPAARPGPGRLRGRRGPAPGRPDAGGACRRGDRRRPPLDDSGAGALTGFAACCMSTGPPSA
jgi:hypothetical protein